MNTTDPLKRIKEVIESDERLERVDCFQLTSRADSILGIVVTLAVSVLVILLALYALPLVLSPAQFEEHQSEAIMVPLILGSVWSMLIWTKQVPLIIACTDRRIIVTGFTKEAWLMSVYSDEIEKVEKFESRSGQQLIRLYLSKGRKSFTYIDNLVLHGIRDAGVLVDHIEQFRRKNLTRPEGQIDYNNNFSLKRKESPRSMVLFGLLMLTLAVFQCSNTVQSQSWPKVSAEVISATVSRNSSIYCWLKGDFKHKFYVERQIRFSTGASDHKVFLVDKDAECLDTEPEAEAARALKQVEVFYRPDKPEIVTLDPARDLSRIVLPLFVGLAFIFGAIEADYIFKNREGWKRTLGMYSLIAVHFVLFCVIWSLYPH